MTSLKTVSEEYVLTGFDQMVEGGFLVPFYRRTKSKTNMPLVVVPQRPGDPRSPIGAFKEAPGLNELAYYPVPTDLHVELGDPIIHAIAIDQEVFIGTVDQLKVQLGALFSNLITTHPLSLLSVFGSEQSDYRVELLNAARRLIDSRLGSGRGAKWIVDDFLSREIHIVLNRLLDANHPKVFGRLQRADIITKLEGKKLDIELPTVFEEVKPMLLEHSRIALRALHKDILTSLNLPSLGTWVGLSTGATHNVIKRVEKELPARVLLITIGKRAGLVARVVERSRRHRRHFTNELYTATNLDIWSVGSTPLKETYDGYLVLIDDKEAFEHLTELFDVFDYINQSGKGDAPVILVPILPAAHSSALIDEGFSQFTRKKLLDYVLDTSIVRSPAWWGTSGGSTNWRLAELIDAASSAISSNHFSIRQRDKQIFNSGKDVPILCLSVSSAKEPPNYFSEVVILDAITKELWQPSRPYDWLKTAIRRETNRGSENQALSLYSLVTSRQRDFRVLANEAVSSVLDKSLGNLDTWLSSEEGPTINFWESVRPQSSSIIHVSSPDLNGSILVSECRLPWSTITEQAQKGISCVRYSDRISIKRNLHRLADNSESVGIPIDFNKPNLRRLRSNLAFNITAKAGPTAGIKPEDFNEWRSNFPNHPFSITPRFVLSGISKSSKNPLLLILHTDLFDNFNRKTDGFEELLNACRFVSFDGMRHTSKSTLRNSGLLSKEHWKIAIPLRTQTPRPFIVDPSVVIPSRWAQTFGRSELFIILASRAFRVWWQSFGQLGGRITGALGSIQPLNRFPFPFNDFRTEKEVRTEPVQWSSNGLTATTLPMLRQSRSIKMPFELLHAHSLVADSFIGENSLLFHKNAALPEELEHWALDYLEIPHNLNDIELFEALCQKAGLELR